MNSKRICLGLSPRQFRGVSGCLGVCSNGLVMCVDSRCPVAFGFISRVVPVGR